MKNLFIGKYWVIALCLLSVQSLTAKDVYLSVNGVDTNNGASESGAVATLTKALSLIEDGDNIRVSGIIDVSKEVSGIEGVAMPQMAFRLLGILLRLQVLRVTVLHGFLILTLTIKRHSIKICLL